MAIKITDSKSCLVAPVFNFRNVVFSWNFIVLKNLFCLLRNLKVEMVTNENSEKVGSSQQKDTKNDQKTMVQRCSFTLSNKTLDILRIIRIRTLLTIAMLSLVSIFYCVSNEAILFLGLIPVLFIWAEAIYLCVKNEAKDCYWWVSSLLVEFLWIGPYVFEFSSFRFSASTFVYILFNMAFLWRGAHEKHSLNDADCSNPNRTGGSEFQECFAVSWN